LRPTPPARQSVDLQFSEAEGTKQFTLAVPYLVGGGMVLRDPDDLRVAGVATKTA